MIDNISEIDSKKTKLTCRPLVVVIPILILALASALSFLFLDERVFLNLRQNPLEWTSSDSIEAFKMLGKSLVPIWFLLLWYYKKKDRLRPTLIVLLSLLLVAPTVTSIKAAVRRPRPRDIVKESWTDEYRKDPFRSWSFPSGDTAAAFAAASAATTFVSWYWAAGFLTAAGVVGFLRVAVFAHYPSDVFAGAAVGVFCAWLAIQIAKCKFPYEAITISWSRPAAFWCLFIIPVIIWLGDDFEQLMLFVKFYGLPTLIIFMIFKLYARTNKKKVNSINNK